MFVDLKESTVRFARQFERLPEPVQKQLMEAVGAMAGMSAPNEPDFIVWTTAEGMQSRCIELLVKGFVNAN